jgi:hypothetical protein
MSKARSFSQVNYMQHFDEGPPKTARPGEIIAYYKIASHYKWALTQLFNKRKFERVIILEDDMEIAPDFFKYFEATSHLLDNDRTLLAVSAWNDNGQTQFVHDSGKSDFGCSRDSWPGIFRIPMLLLLISGQISFLSNCTPIMYEVVFCLYLLWVIL